MNKISCVILDLDNTLYDWVEMWYSSFEPMLTEVSKIANLPIDEIKTDFKKTHQEHGTSEYSFRILESELLKNKFPNQDLDEHFKTAIHVEREKYDAVLNLYPSVLKTLITLKSKGIKIVAYTDSMGFYTTMRLKRLGLDGVIDTVYSLEDHSLPEGMEKEKYRSRPSEFYELQVTKIVAIPESEIKPNPELLLKIIADMGMSKDQCIYVGDSLERDIDMAQKAGVSDVWAKYGKVIEPYKYELLKDVTHWTESQVIREKTVENTNEIKATYKIDKFSELLDIFDFEQNKLNENDKSIVLEVWKKTIEVQQHFNEIEMKIRSLFVSIFTAILALYGYFIKSDDSLSFLIDSFFVWTIISITLLFYFTDRYWYHRLLNGSVKQGMDLEKVISAEIPQVNLTSKIKENSPLEVYQWIVFLRNLPFIGFFISLFINDPNFKKGKIHSDAKIEIFYKTVILGMLIMWAISFYIKAYDTALVWIKNHILATCI